MFILLSTLILLIPGAALAFGLAWLVRRVSIQAWLAAGVLVLAGMLLPTSILVGLLSDYTPPYQVSVAILLIALPCLALVLAALLLASGFQLKWGAAGEAASAWPWPAVGLIAAAFVLSGLLLARTLFNLYWLMVWDSTTDSLDFLWLIPPMLAALTGGLILIFSLPGRRLAAAGYALAVPALLVWVSIQSDRIHFRLLTDQRAERISQMLAAYHEREGRYPDDLRQLAPWYSLGLPEPVIIYGQDWCYQAGKDFYRLGYVDREHWSDPRLIGHVYTVAGQAPGGPGVCNSELSALRDRNPFYRAASQDY